MTVDKTHVFPGFLTPALTQLFFPKPSNTFLICLCRGERRKYTGKKSRLNWGSNSQPPGHESDTLNTEPPRWTRQIRADGRKHAHTLNCDCDFYVSLTASGLHNKKGEKFRFPSFSLFNDAFQNLSSYRS